MKTAWPRRLAVTARPVPPREIVDPDERSEYESCLAAWENK
jgi:hypothetical protein